MPSNTLVDGTKPDSSTTVGSASTPAPIIVPFVTGRTETNIMVLDVVERKLSGRELIRYKKVQKARRNDKEKM